MNSKSISEHSEPDCLGMNTREEGVRSKEAGELGSSKRTHRNTALIVRDKRVSTLYIIVR